MAAKPSGCALACRAHFRQWTSRELDLQREVASASSARLVAEPGYVPELTGAARLAVR
jgi:hypothetical protein